MQCMQTRHAGIIARQAVFRRLLFHACLSLQPVKSFETGLIHHHMLRRELVLEHHLDGMQERYKKQSQGSLYSVDSFHSTLMHPIGSEHLVTKGCIWHGRCK